MRLICMRERSVLRTLPVSICSSKGTCYCEVASFLSNFSK